MKFIDKILNLFRKKKETQKVVFVSVPDWQPIPEEKIRLVAQGSGGGCGGPKKK